MNETLQNSLALILKKAIDGVDATVGFLSAQLPDVVHQLIMWKLAEAIFWAIVYLIPLVLLFFFLWMGRRNNWYKYTEGYNKGDARFEYWCPMGLAAVLIVTPMSYGSLVWLAQAIQIVVAPKIYLIEYAAKLIK